MRVAYRLLNFYYDAVEFLRNHKLRLIALLIIFVLACAFGIRSGCGADAEAVLEGRRNYAMLVSAEGRSVVGYIFANLLFFLLCTAFFIFSAINMWVALLGFVAFFYIVYMMGYTVAIFFSCFKLAALPYLLVCYIPFCFIAAFALACIIVAAIDCGLRMRSIGYICREPFRDCLPVFIIGGSTVVIVVLCEGILGGVFTAGLII